MLQLLIQTFPEAESWCYLLPLVFRTRGRRVAFFPNKKNYPQKKIYPQTSYHRVFRNPPLALALLSFVAAPILQGLQGHAALVGVLHILVPGTLDVAL